MNITELTVRQLAQALERKEISAREAAQSYLNAIVEKDGQVGAYLTVPEEPPPPALQKCWSILCPPMTRR